MRYFLSSPRSAAMRFTRALPIRSTFHTRQYTTRGEGSATTIVDLARRVSSTLWDDCPGIPYNNPFLARVLENMTSDYYSDYPAVTERHDYDTKDSTSYSYRKLGTDIYGTRKEILKIKEVEGALRDYDRSYRGFSVGLMADRSYEFVVNLLTLMSIGARPVLISNTSKPAEIQNLMQTARTPFLIPPSKFFKEQPWVQDFIRDHPDYKIWSNEALESWKDARPLSEEQLAQEYTIPTSKTKQGTILFTSGTTGNPKAVFTDISSISQQCSALRSLWEYNEEDRLLHVLPNHHIHGLVNCLLTPLTSGSAVEFITQPFNAHKVLERISKPPSVDFPPITMFHGVPTMYSSFISAYESYDDSRKEKTMKGLRRLRVAVCGSAALPVPIAKKWEQITGSIPLERYGMTETGMVLSNSLDVSLRRLGSVGYPMPGVHVHLIDPNDRLIMVPDVPGKLVVRWHNESQLFHKYWNDVKATNKAKVKPEQIAQRALDKIEDGKVMMKTMKLKKFDRRALRQKVRDYWFRTGDMAVRGEDGEYYMLGRESVDILKVAGHLVSALEIEREILTLKEILEVAVVGVKSAKFGSIPQAIIGLKPEYAQKLNSPQRPQEPEGESGEGEGEGITGADYKKELINSLRKRMREKLSEEKLPRRWIIVDSIPRNAMGKVNKKQLLADETLFPKGLDGEVSKKETSELDNSGEANEIIEQEEVEEEEEGEDQDDTKVEGKE
ncbi:hypothetical protein TWF718_006310 [Orbilia javanica]|uniref:AMP-dependent synthetase/ligase domain-containing protein n=1 Tax=Orbilia javanica TaxID=47235 RepID=A0AAN8RPM3_9PEZI